MRDYLEELLNGAGALLEELRRAERGLSGPAGAESPKNVEISGKIENIRKKHKSVYDRKNQVDQMEKIVDKPEILKKSPGEQENTIVNYGERTGDIPGPVPVSGGETEAGEEKGKQPPLAVQLERMERAASAAAGGAPRLWRRAEWGSESPPPAGFGTAGSSVSETDLSRGNWTGTEGRSPSGGGPDWVERADRAFRRDSRRYDGGFYLY